MRYWFKIVELHLFASWFFLTPTTCFFTDHLFLSPQMWRPSFSKFAIRASALGFLNRSFSREAGKRFAALWGNGDYGRLGLGNLDSQWKPVVCPAFRNQTLKAIACGGAHTLFLTGSLFFLFFKLGILPFSFIYLFVQLNRDLLIKTEYWIVFFLIVIVI